MSPELRHLRAFVVLAEELSFSVAAGRLHVTQQSLSRTIQQLERELGTTLFARTTRSVRLTPAGQEMLTSATRATAAADEAFALGRRVARGEPALPLRVDLSSGGLETGAAIVARLRREAPGVVVEQAEHGVPRGLVLLAQGGLDVVLGIATHAPEGIATELVRREPVVIGMRADHPLAGRAQVRVADLADVELLLPARDVAPEWLELVAGFCREAGVTPRRRPGVTHGSVAAAQALREESCVVPTARWADPPAGLVFRPLTEPAPILPWSAMWADGAERRAEVAAFLDAARATGAAAGWLDGEV